MALVTAFSGAQVILKLRARYADEGTGATAEEHTVEGFSGASDAVKFEENQEIVNSREGMDGYVFYAQSGRLGGLMTIKMLPNGKSVPWLMTKGYEQKTGRNIAWEGDITLGDETGVTAELSAGMITHVPPFPTVGMSNIDDLQFSFRFARITASFERANFDIFAGPETARSEFVTP